MKEASTRFKKVITAVIICAVAQSGAQTGNWWIGDYRSVPKMYMTIGYKTHVARYPRHYASVSNCIL